jgi:hypothetical protein
VFSCEPRPNCKRRESNTASPSPYTDTNLRKKPKACAEFVKSLITRNLIELAGLQDDHGGFGVTCKKIDKQTVGEQGQASKRLRHGVEDFVSARR